MSDLGILKTMNDAGINEKLLEQRDYQYTANERV